jgi:putative transposase
MLTGNPGHATSFDYLGLHRYSLTFCTYKRACYFTEKSRVDLVFEQIVRSATENEFGIFAYGFMPDHVHLLVEGLCDASNALTFIDRAKQYSGYYFKKAFHGKLWQRYGFEHTLRDDEAALSVARYILENPVRAGLVRRVQDYPFCGSLMYPVDHILDAVAMMPTWRRKQG